MSVVEIGYLERPYLEDLYMSGLVLQSTFEQIEFRIDSSKSILEQIDQAIAASKNVGEQIDQRIDASNSVLEQVDRQNSQSFEYLEQVDQRIDTTQNIREQIDQAVGSSKSALEQTTRFITQPKAVFEQVDRRIDAATKAVNEQIKRGKFIHSMCGGYLDTFGYLTEPYLGPKFCVGVPEQVERIANGENDIPEQIERRIDVTKNLREQVERRIDKIKITFEQVDRIQSFSFGEQVTFALYNTTNLRVLADFPSRGTNGLNWTASSTASGDFSVNNLNSDIVEEIWKSNGAISGINLTCDTGITQGIFMDTLAILNHNMTTSASIVIQASNDSGFASVGFTHTLINKLNNTYYIAPMLPLVSFRYWRLLISDPTNSSGYISIGTIVFGSAIIMQQTCITQNVSKATKHFSDKIQTEGFTSVSNDRAIKYSVGMEMRHLSYDKGDYTRLRSIFDGARTSLKCLWIPTPRFPERFAIFGKLTGIPVEQHNVIDATADYIDFSIEVDESL